MANILTLGKEILASNFIRLKTPYKVTYAITYQCNARCITCNIWKKKPGKELAIWEIRKIFSKLAIPWVNLTGGEPFLRDDLYDIARVLRPTTYILNFITNGSVHGSVEVASRIARLGFPKFILGTSIDGPKGLHDLLRGVKGAWEMAINTFKGFRSALGVEPYIGYTISQYNSGKISSTVSELKKHIPDLSLADIHFNICHESPHYLSNLGALNPRAHASQIAEDVEFVLKNKRLRGVIGLVERLYLKQAKQYLKTSKPPLPCKALASSCFISPVGEVYPCTEWGISIGNLRNYGYDLSRVWNSQKARQLREDIKRGKCPGCWTPCEAYQTIYGNLLNPKVYYIK